MRRILVTGAAGQIGSELVPALRAIYGDDAVLATDLRPAADPLAGGGPFAILDCMEAAAFANAVQRHRADTIFHLAALLSVTAESDPRRAFEINIGTLVNALEVARAHGCAVFAPSSIAAFGPNDPRDPAPQDGPQHPTSMYGVTKVAGERLADYYFLRYGVDTRGVRFPGLISWRTPPGGGTTDYAVHMYSKASRGQPYICFLESDTQLDMMYMPDAIRATIEIMEADPDRLEHRNAFNIAAMQLTPAQLAESIRRYVPEFHVEFEPDAMRQAIADSWPLRLDDRSARAEWGWAPEWGLDRMTEDMLRNLGVEVPAPV